MNKPRFIEFNQAWEKVLREFRIDRIHMADFVRPYGRYCTMAPEMKKGLFTSVAKAINRSKEYSLSISVPHADYESLLALEVSRQLMGAYAFAFFITVLTNYESSRKRHYNNRTAYLVDKGTPLHHEQMQAAHRVILYLEKARGERYTGAMTSDIDDNNNALQAADVVAWSRHRDLESEDFGEEYEPLRAIFKKSQIPERSDGAVLRPHIKIHIPLDGIEMFAKIINNWIPIKGTGIPTK